MAGGFERFLEFVVAPIIFFGGLGAAAGWWIETQVKRRRLRKLGFSAADLESKEAILAKWGEITLARIPERISFCELASHSWSEPLRYADCRKGFESLGFQRKGVFVASPQKWVAEFWTDPTLLLCAAIVDSPSQGPHAQIMFAYDDGSTFCFENTEDCGHRHPERHASIHCGVITPGELVAKALHDRPTKPLRTVDPANCVSVYEQAVNEGLAWRRTVGFSAGEMEHLYERFQKRKRSAKK